MAKKTKLIPFSMTPASWGLHGDSRRIAEAEYLYDGEQLERALAEIKYEGKDLDRQLAAIDYRWHHTDAYAYDLRLLEIDGKADDTAEVLALGLKHGKMSQYDYDVSKAKLDFPKAGKDRNIALLEVDSKHGKVDEYEAAVKIAEMKFEEGPEREMALLDVRKAHGKVTDHEYEKEKATIEEEPWIAIIDSGFDPDQGINGVYFEFDWNEQWITYLRLNGYTGPTDAAVVDSWFTDVCRAQGLAPTNGGDPFAPVPFSGRI